MPELEAFQGSISSNSQGPVMGKGGQVANGNLSDSASESELEFREEAVKESKELPTVLNVVSAVLERLVARNEKLGGTVPTTSPLNARKLTTFHGLRAPGITISKYMERIFKYTNCSPSCFVVGYVYIDRLIHNQPDLPVTSLNVHRLLVTAVMVATKMLDDVHFNNSFFARVGGVSVTELNRLEMELLVRLDFKVQVSTSEFEFYCTHLEKEVMRDERWRVDRSLPLPSPTFRSPTFRSPTFRSPAASPLLDTPKKRLPATLSGTFDRAAVHALISSQFNDSRTR